MAKKIMIQGTMSNAGKRQQYIWGVWQVTGIREGDTWDETDELVGAVYEMLPES